MDRYIGRQFGNYRLVSLLGQGGFSEVYLGKHIHLGTQAAVKILLAQLWGDDRDTFHNEARTLAHMIHPNIIRVLEFGIEEGIPFLIMDYASHGTLRQRFPKGVPVSTSTVLSYIKQASDALQYIHNKGLIHRDIKPQNLLLGGSDEVLLSDFGIAVIAREAATPDEPRDLRGTVGYLAPEQLNGKASFPSDQYALVGQLAIEYR